MLEYILNKYMRTVTPPFHTQALDPQTTNGGYCFVWAWMAWRHHPSARLVSLDYFSSSGWVGSHAVLLLGGRYYDAETAKRGVKYPENLPISRRLKYKWGSVIVREMRETPSEYKKAWGTHDAFTDLGLKPYPRQGEQPFKDAALGRTRAAAL